MYTMDIYVLTKLLIATTFWFNILLVSLQNDVAVTLFKDMKHLFLRIKCQQS